MTRQLKTAQFGRFAAVIAAAGMLAATDMPMGGAATAEAKNPIFQRIGGWVVLVSARRGNGCYMTRSYPNRQSVRLGIDVRKQNFYLAFFNNSWRSLRRGQNYDIQATFDRDRRTAAKGRGTGTQLAALPNRPGSEIPGLSLEGLKYEYVQRFANRRSMQIYYKGNRIGEFDLTGSRAAWNSLLNCQRRYGIGRGGSGRGNDPFSNGRTNDPFAGGGQRSNDPFSGGSANRDPFGGSSSGGGGGFGQKSVGSGSGGGSNDPFY